MKNPLFTFSRIIAFGLTAAISGHAYAQTIATRSVGDDVKATLKGVFVDQKLILTSPARLRWSDAAWLVPDAGIATGLFVTDRTTSRQLSRSSHKNLSNELSNAGLAAIGVTDAGMYLLALRNGDPRMRETGLLGAEAAVDALPFDELLKYGSRRDRPNVDNGQGNFFQPGGASFPSAHATLSFAMATVISKEYPGWLTKTLAYGTATAVSFARVPAQQHFPSDVFIGATAGYLIGNMVYHKHHDPSIDAFYGTFDNPVPEPLDPARMSSPYIEMDSWIYPAVERLSSLGIIDSAYVGLRPWTRMSVYGMLVTANESQANTEAQRLLNTLHDEFKREEALANGRLNRSIGISRLYERSQEISGKPLDDSFHLGQTIVDDFGRPYGSGFQQLAGYEVDAEDGRFSFFSRGEGQHSPSLAAYPPQLSQTLATIDNIPGETLSGSQSQNVFRLLDTYASFNLLSNEISVGKQTYFWGPDDSTALMISDNVEPIYSLRLNRTVPLYIPLFSKLFGPIRYDNYFGRLHGTHYPADPFTYGQKISLHPTKNLELGFSRNAMFAGQGLEPLTLHTFLKSFFSTSSGTMGTFNPRNTPGARHANFDFRYRLPFLRDWMTLYTDSFVHDDLSPIDAPRRAAVVPGIYLAKFPRLNKLDLHIEGGTTDTVTTRAAGGDFYYFENLYRDSYLNKGYLLGSWIGREGTGGQAWATYWFTPQSTFAVGFRDVKVSHLFLPQGETQQDGYAVLKYQSPTGFGVQALVQQERWVAPILAPGPQHDFTAQLELSYSPKSWRISRH